MTSVTALVVDGITDPIETSIDNLLAEGHELIVLDISTTNNKEMVHEEDITYYNLGSERRSLMDVCKKAEQLAAEAANLMGIELITLLLLEPDDSYEYPKGQIQEHLRELETGFPFVVTYTDPFGEMTQTGIVNRLKSEVFWSRYGYTTKLVDGRPHFSLSIADTLEGARVNTMKVVLRDD